MSFKVIEIGINRKPVWDFLLVMNSNWHPLSYRFGVISAYCSNFGHFAFFSPPLGEGGLQTTYDVHLKLIEKRVVEFLLVLIELFSLGVMAKALRAKIDRKSKITPTRPVWPKISDRRRRPPPIVFARIVRTMNALQYVADSFYAKKLYSRLSSIEVRL